MKWSPSIKAFKFEESIRKINLLILGNFILVILSGFPDYQQLIYNIHTLACLVSFLLFLFIRFLYDWQSQFFNAIWLTMYLLIFAIEFYIAGMPKPLLTLQMGKGIMFDMIVSLFPIVYTLLRLVLVYPVLGVIYWLCQLDNITD